MKNIKNDIFEYLETKNTPKHSKHKKSFKEAPSGKF
jgi:hypothetical protein